MVSMTHLEHTHATALTDVDPGHGEGPSWTTTCASRRPLGVQSVRLVGLAADQVGAQKPAENVAA
jgi:hypothetical protein